MCLFDLHFKQFKENISQMFNFVCLPRAFSNFLLGELRRHALFTEPWFSPAAWVGCQPPPRVPVMPVTAHPSTGTCSGNHAA